MQALAFLAVFVYATQAILRLNGNRASLTYCTRLTGYLSPATEHLSCAAAYIFLQLYLNLLSPFLSPDLFQVLLSSSVALLCPL